MEKWQKIEKGIYVKLHPSRRHGIGYDRLWKIRTTVEGKEEIRELGWSSLHNITLTKARMLLAKLQAGLWNDKIDEMNHDNNAQYNNYEKHEMDKSILSRKSGMIKGGNGLENKSHNISIVPNSLKGTGFFDDVQEIPVVTIRDLWITYNNSKKGRPSALTDLYNYKHIDKVFGERIVYTLRTHEIVKFNENFSKNHKPATVKNVLELFRRIINSGVKNGRCAYIPPNILRFEMPVFDNIKTEILTMEQQANYLKALDEEKDQNLASLVRLTFVTGIRRKAMLALKWVDIDFERRFIRLSSDYAKNRRVAYIPMSNRACKILKDLYEKRTDSPYVFPSPTGGMRKEIRRLLTRVKKKAGLPEDFRPLHGLRHHFATAVGNSQKVSDRTLQELLTQRDPRMSRRYNHLMDNVLIQAANQADKAYEQAEKNKGVVVRKKRTQNPD